MLMWVCRGLQCRQAPPATNKIKDWWRWVSTQWGRHLRLAERKYLGGFGGNPVGFQTVQVVQRKHMRVVVGVYVCARTQSSQQVTYTVSRDGIWTESLSLRGDNASVLTTNTIVCVCGAYSCLFMYVRACLCVRDCVQPVTVDWRCLSYLWLYCAKTVQSH